MVRLALASLFFLNACLTNMIVSEDRLWSLGRVLFKEENYIQPKLHIKSAEVTCERRKQALVLELIQLRSMSLVSRLSFCSFPAMRCYVFPAHKLFFCYFWMFVNLTPNGNSAERTRSRFQSPRLHSVAFLVRPPKCCWWIWLCELECLWYHHFLSKRIEHHKLMALINGCCMGLFNGMERCILDVVQWVTLETSHPSYLKGIF